MFYEVAKEKGGRYFVHESGNNTPIAGSFKKEKKDALHIAAKLSEIPYRDYLKICKTLKSAT